MGISPVKVALVSVVGAVVTKSSADSISILPVDSGRLADAIRASGRPALKKKVSAFAGPTQQIAERIKAKWVHSNSLHPPTNGSQNPSKDRDGQEQNLGLRDTR